MSVFRCDLKLQHLRDSTASPGRRGKVEGLSAASRRRLLHVGHNGPDWVCMLRLSYGDWPEDGRTCKAHLNAFLTALRRLHQVEGVSYVWVLEFQKRGAPHFHVLVNRWVPKGWLTRRWASIIGEPANVSSTNVKSVNDNTHAARYLVKYAAKEEQKEVPAGFRNVGRMWGTSRDVAKPEASYYLTTSQGDRVRRALVTMVEKRTGVERRHGRQGATLYGGADEGVRLLCYAAEMST